MSRHEGEAIKINVEAHGGFDKNLFSAYEDVQDNATKNFHFKLKFIKDKMKSLEKFIFFQMQLKVIIVPIFIATYWISGYSNSAK